MVKTSTIKKITTINDEITKANEITPQPVCVSKWSYTNNIKGFQGYEVTISTDVEDYSESGSNGHDITNDYYKQVFKIDNVPAIEIAYDDEIAEHVSSIKVLNPQALSDLLQSFAITSRLYE